jgi:hypothetical protein
VGTVAILRDVTQTFRRASHTEAATRSTSERRSEHRRAGMITGNVRCPFQGRTLRLSLLTENATSQFDVARERSSAMQATDAAPIRLRDKSKILIKSNYLIYRT